MNFFEQELRKLFADSDALRDIRFTGRVCLARLTDTTNVKLEFVTLGYADNYEGIKATVLNRREGPIDSTVFRFADFLGKKAVPGNPNFTGGVIPHVVKLGDKYDWYAYKPTPRDFEIISETVESYLEAFGEPIQTQDMTMEMY
jgi:hypothetical protein